MLSQVTVDFQPSSNVEQAYKLVRLHGRMISSASLTPHVQSETMLAINFQRDLHCMQ